ncbi:uncharacterized protein ppp1r3aa [Halichoeres trimaculatus]|uniref:uncharacterized protein ppp1r3aa n=1 Tax=Halichoeres trimaculatus TaxID=147232 RepID=UPI003D9F669F
MEALYMQPFEDKRLTLEKQEEEKRREQEEDASDEETDEDSEPEPPSVIQRKVSFADAFGLDLVSVKEFDNVEVTESGFSPAPESEGTFLSEEFYMTCLFTVPSCSEELDQRLQGQMVELESIELLPGTSTLRGIIRVVNLSYSKSVYVRITLDRWTSCFDLLAEYVPGSSDRKTDRFTFQYTLIPPFEKKGTRVEFCLRFETSVGTFWANNHRMNYVLFCHQRGHVQELGPQVQEESCSYRCKRSCLRANRRGSAQEKALETSYTSTVFAEGEAAQRAQEADVKTKDGAEIRSVLNHEVHKPLVQSIKSRHRMARLAHVQERLAQRRQQALRAYSHDSGGGQDPPQSWAAPWCASASQKKLPTYHQIPLLTLDWNNDRIQQWGFADLDDIWSGGAEIGSSKTSAQKDETPSVVDMWETFHNGADDTADKGLSVCDVWQAFLNGASCMDHSNVPESEWLQTATSMSPSKDKEPKTQFASSSQEHEIQVAKDPPTTLNRHTSAACQPLSHSVNTEDHQPAEACVSSRRDDNTVTQEAPQRSQTNWVTDLPQEFSLKGATPMSEGSADASAECHKQVMWERGRGGITGGAGRDETLKEHTADFETSSGESMTTGLTETPESQNANRADRISQGAGLDRSLSSPREGEVTGTATDDTLAFPGTKDRERFVFATSRQTEGKAIMNNCTANRVSTEEEVFRPQKTEGCEISQRYADEKHHEEFRLNQYRENPLQQNERDENETRPEQSHSDELNPSLKCEGDVEEIQTRGGEIISGEGREEKEGETTFSSNRGTKTGGKWYNWENVGLKSETGDYTFSSDQNEEVRSSRCDEIISEPQETTPSAQKDKPEDSIKVLSETQSAFPPEMKWTHSHEDVKGRREDGGDETRREVTANETVVKKDDSPELQRQPELLEIIEEHIRCRDKDERGSVGRLKIAAEQLMGNAENPQGERKNSPDKMEEEEELSAGVESSPRVECKKLSKEDIKAEEALEVIKSGLGKMIVERFGESLVKRIWEEVFDWKEGGIDGLSVDKTHLLDITETCHPLFEKDFSDTFDSGVFSVIETPNDLTLSTCQGFEQTSTTQSDEFPSEELNQSLSTEEQTYLQTESSSSVHLSQDLNSVLAAQSSTEPARSSGNFTQLKERSVCKENIRSTDKWERLQSSSQDDLKEPKCLVWWSMLYILYHITRLLICIIFIAGFFVVVFLYDFPAFFALYMFSLCCWFSQWRRHGVTTNKGMVGYSKG